MAWTVEPALDHLVGGFRTIRNVFSHQLLGVADGANAICGRVPGQILVLEILVAGHVGGMAQRDVIQRVGQCHGRCGTEGTIAAARAAGADLIDERQRTHGKGSTLGWRPRQG